MNRLSDTCLPHIGCTDCHRSGKAGFHRAENVERIENGIIRIFQNGHDLRRLLFAPILSIAFETDTDMLSKSLGKRK